MSSYRDILNNQSAWYPSMSRPASWGELLISHWQEQIDLITGTTNGRPRLSLRWGPEVMRWRPSRIGEGAYDFPEWTVGFSGREPIALPRWVLMERHEPEQFAPGWELHRRMIWEGRQYDIRGPLPKERYTKVYAHMAHEDGCCLRNDPCFGYYVEPNDELLNWVRERWRSILQDPDVQPFRDARHFHAPNAQREWKNEFDAAREAKREAANEIFDDLLEHADRRPASVGVN